MILFINTSQAEEATLLLDDGKRIFNHSFATGFNRTDTLLKHISVFLTKRKVETKELEGIAVVTGPGPFTSLRIGVVVANTLGYALNIKVVGIKATDFKSDDMLVKKGKALLAKAKNFQIVEPFYGRAPNITKPKKR
ncbi:tRNA (adenosine(37)-N6)-threonylcarbamoyltransferase complex dimerization subunit type 1 TsaB [Patescibacteria group bacterium]|nr:tRNA (adenosine(37)-N6)-threonylcarbamoyltransferase complex dimerization subunit type 1 TsaB [Patescibacteria group bacterium]MBU1952147.1 tRNA (adenosine(37)-N6)-threonylcarbamoyltransferase complex dimerization subunit type 1 TsaB [Patescibacteria group bacterium]MBU2229321.1 tRNA (adenosine(37)-N6)-threonylcarbamoyltransferase complex dimerization subunit type 1 TsaB [Patescibacteria group bacterium]